MRAMLVICLLGVGCDDSLEGDSVEDMSAAVDDESTGWPSLEFVPRPTKFPRTDLATSPDLIYIDPRPCLDSGELCAAAVAGGRRCCSSICLPMVGTGLQTCMAPPDLAPNPSCLDVGEVCWPPRVAGLTCCTHICMIAPLTGLQTCVAPPSP